MADERIKERDFIDDEAEDNPLDNESEGVVMIGKGDSKPPLTNISPQDPRAGMFMGPEHPIFHRNPQRSGRNILPPEAHPAGARFDPIMPPFRGGEGGEDDFYASGEPDFDEFLPPPPNPPARSNKKNHPSNNPFDQPPFFK